MAFVSVANTNKGMDDSRRSMGISEDGNLVVLDGEKTVVWSSSKSNISNSSLATANTTAQLLDTGNLVLKDSSSGRYLWESFGDNTDTFLENMKLGNGASIGITRELRSWKSPWDPSPGTFSSSSTSKHSRGRRRKEEASIEIGTGRMESSVCVIT
ncbi:PREDICTED: G-type lectin S-receptor-like serine/threonine-protein kinase At1g11300 [Ipomoea nil]|uniref:G-type lectin S-receptor-like serine/threonine-protein kinase At1g11300 n=1 Tax=Ipomoea nil TaxID=35883 RepID=UPI0009012BAD|nr:PREDICTED: G-type lectin S-receptor-like serine/threonine-protein kinase At1g11300 [Ipomoea nil]